MKRRTLVILVAVALITSCSKDVAFKWTKNKLELAELIGLDSTEVLILASLVELETDLKKEKGKIARVFMNRLEMGIPLQSDPSVKFAIGDLTEGRLLAEDLKFKSPYNTYLNIGLPPGPICTPSRETIKEVLTSEKSDFIYFCPSPALNGSFNYASTLMEHNKNAKLYLKALNESNSLNMKK